MNLEERLCLCVLSHTKVVAASAVTNAGKSDLSFLSSNPHLAKTGAASVCPLDWRECIVPLVSQGQRASETLVLLQLRALSNEVFTKLKSKIKVGSRPEKKVPGVWQTRD